MLSATYRQASNRSPKRSIVDQVKERDPDNRLLSRMKARRLSFEQSRDTLLALSGELDTTMGGRAVDVFPPGRLSRRRSIYGLVDRQYVPGVLRVFDFANPDLHTGARVETIVPQQALYALNNAFVAGRARAIVRRLAISKEAPPADGIRRLYQVVLQRGPSSAEARRAIEFLQEPAVKPDLASATSKPSVWSYGYGEVDADSGAIKSFQPLPFFSGGAWQGGPRLPDATLGWVQLTAEGGHPGNDTKHAAVRRWTAPSSGSVALSSEFIHEPSVGDGVRYWVLSNRHGVLTSGAMHQNQKRVDIEKIKVQTGDTLDFVVDIKVTLNSDQFLWSPELRLLKAAATATSNANVVWSAKQDFPKGVAMLAATLNRWEQLTHVLLMSNELMFVD